MWICILLCCFYMPYCGCSAALIAAAVWLLFLFLFCSRILWSVENTLLNKLGASALRRCFRISTYVSHIYFGLISTGIILLFVFLYGIVCIVNTQRELNWFCSYSLPLLLWQPTLYFKVFFLRLQILLTFR